MIMGQKNHLEALYVTFLNGTYMYVPNLKGRLGGLCCIWILPCIESHKIQYVK